MNFPHIDRILADNPGVDATDLLKHPYKQWTAEERDYLKSLAEPPEPNREQEQPQVQVNVHVEEMAEADVEDVEPERVSKAEPTDAAKDAEGTLPYGQGRFVDPLPDVPQIMKQLRQWIRWKLEPGPDGKPTKVPYQVNGAKASSTDPNTWTDYRTAVTGVKIDSTGGVGFVVAGDIVGFDLDGCYDALTDTIAPWAEKIIDMLDSYTEITPSETGLRVWVRGVLPGKDKVFKLNPTIGCGSKVQVEVFTEKKYFTVTGQTFEHTNPDVQERNLTAVYQMLHEIRAQHPVPINPKSAVADTVDAGYGSGVAIEYAPGTTLKTDKYTIFKRGHVVEGTPNFQITDGVGTLIYSSHSEADLGFATVLAVLHDGDEKKMEDDFRDSPMWREKWERTKQYDFPKALATANKIKESKPMDLTNAAPTLAQAKADAAAEASKNVTGTFPNADDEALADENAIPPFDDSVITGIFRDIVDLAASGTTIPRQFPFLVAKIYVGTRMAGVVTFEGIEDDPTVYGAAIGATGTSKGLSWKRTALQVLLPEALIKRKVIVFTSFDSGAGIRDAFLDHEMPIIGCIEEIRSLGHKAGEKKNPEIIDSIVELANSHYVSKVKATKGKSTKSRSYDKAYLSLYMCGQNGEAYMSSFPGRKEMGLWDRFYPEYADPIVPDDLPEIDVNQAIALIARLEKLLSPGRMTMGEGVKDTLKLFWNEQPKDVKEKVRFKSHLMLDMYFSAWSQGRMVATVEDLDVAIRIFHRQMAIRRVHFQQEVPDRVGHFIGLLKVMTEKMRKRLNKGESMESVAVSLRDIQTATNAYRDNEIEKFNIAWRNFHKDHLATFEWTAKNGQKYMKYLPMPYEDEMWAATPEAKAGEPNKEA